MTTLTDLFGDGSPPPPGTGPHTKHANAWHITADAVVCEFGHKDPKGVAWEMLAYGLEYVERHGKHRLVLVLPKTPAEHTAVRAALLRPGIVEIWRYGSGKDAPLTSVPIPAMSEALEAFRRTKKSVEFRPNPLDTTGLPGWMLELGDWIESRNVERQRYDGAWSWHYRGREVLKVTPGKSTTRVAAGVRFTGGNKDKFGDGTYESFKVSNAAGPDGDVVDRIKELVDAAIERRRTKSDDGAREHMLQATIGVDPNLVGMRYVRRELASGRLQSSSATFIDFLGVDDDGGLHVIETKLGHNDAQLAMQGLDYWGWVVAHLATIVEALHAEGHDDVDAGRWPTIRYVVGQKEEGRTVHAAAAAALGALRSDIDWRVQLLRNWDTLSPDHRPLSLPEDIGPTRDRQLPIVGD